MFKKIAAAVVAAGMAIGSAFAGATPAQAQDVKSLIESPTVNKCSSEFLIVVPGGGNTFSFLPEKAPVGPKVTPLAQTVHQRTGGKIQPVWIAYTAVPFTLMTYNDSARAGYNEATSTIRRLARMCPKATFSITGYSEGAGIGAQLVNNIAHGRGPIPANRMNSAVLISNPHLADNGGVFSGGATASHTGALETLQGGYGELGPRVLDVCRVNDPICSLPAEWRTHVDPMLRIAAFRGKVPMTELAAIVAMRSPTTLPLILSVSNHGKYGDETYVEGANWIISRSAPARP